MNDMIGRFMKIEREMKEINQEGAQSGVKS